MAGKKTAERKKKSAERADKFWGVFRFTENGKPKSSLGVYSFSLSIVYIVILVLCFDGAIRLLTDPLSALPVFWQNLIISLTASAVSTALCCLPHRFFQEKRLVFRSYLWLALYAAVVLVAMLVMVAGEGGAGAFLRAFGWFVAIPVAMGTLTAWLLQKRSMRGETLPDQPEPEWKKYVNRR